MRSVNKVTLLGHVGQEPNIHATQGGGCVANVSLATSYRVAAKDGREAKEVTEWHRLVGFGRTAEIIRDYVHKGAGLFVEGQLQTRSYEKDGDKRYSTEIVIREMSMLSGKSSGAAAGRSGGAAGRGGSINDVPQTKDEYEAQTVITDDDIPF